MGKGEQCIALAGADDARCLRSPHSQLTRNKCNFLPSPAVEQKYDRVQREGYMRFLFVAVLISFVLIVCASAIELFRYNLTTPDGRKFQYIFDVSDPASQSAGDALSREEIVNRAMGWMLSFHKGPDDGSIESVTLRQKPIPHWLVAVADTTDGRIEHLLFAVVLPNGYVVVPTVSEQL
jgi:hypothetical protein